MIETGILFGNIHSYYDLGLILSSVEIPPADPKTNYVDIPGADGSLDLTEAHGTVKYSDRNCNFVFAMSPTEKMTFEEKKTQISNALNGLACKIILDKDDGYYYDGRCTVDKYKQDGHLLQFTVSARVKPYKLKKTETVATFELDATRQTFYLKNSRKPVVPTITITGTELSNFATIYFKGIELAVSDGTIKSPNICLTEGINEIEVLGKGTLTFTYQEGEL